MKCPSGNRGRGLCYKPKQLGDRRYREGAEMSRYMCLTGSVEARQILDSSASLVLHVIGHDGLEIQWVLASGANDNNKGYNLQVNVRLPSVMELKNILSNHDVRLLLLTHHSRHSITACFCKLLREARFSIFSFFLFNKYLTNTISMISSGAPWISK